MAAQLFPHPTTGDGRALRSLTLMALVSATSFFYLGGWPVAARAGFALALVLVSYLFISAMLYLVMRSVEPPLQPRIADSSEATQLRHWAAEFGDGLGIKREGWQVFATETWTAVASLPGGAGSLVYISVESITGPLRPVDFGMYGRQENSRPLISTLTTHAIFPYKGADLFFDLTCTPEALWHQHRNYVGRGGGPLTFEEYVSLHLTDNFVKAVGFVRFALNWGRGVWKQRWFVRGRL